MAMSSRQHPPSLQIPNIIIYFICRIESSFPDERTLFVTTFCKHFMDRIDIYVENEEESQGDKYEKQEKEDTSLLDNDKYYTDDDIYNTITTAPFHLVLCTFIPYIIHNRFMCPFTEINNSFYKLIQHINKKLDMGIPELKPPYPLSGFLASSLKITNLPHTYSNGNNLYNNLYSKFGRISHFELLLLSHSEYFNKYLSDFNNLFYSLMYDNSTGVLTLSRREYLGLMACSRYSCQPLIMQCEVRYILLSGDITWIKSGIKCTPSKYMKLAKINALLAHQPWLINKQHISELISGDNPWTISQCIQTFIILIMFHFLCGMYYGLCITPEIDQYYKSILQNKNNSKNIFKQQPQLYNDNNNNNEIEDNNQNIVQLLSCHINNSNNNINNNNRTKSDTISDTSSTSSSQKKNDKDFEQSALINVNDTMSDDSLSMEFDPNMAPNNTPIQEPQREIIEIKEEKEEEKEINNNNNNKWSRKRSKRKDRDRRKNKKIEPPSSGGILYWKYSLGIDMIYNDFDCHKNYQIHAYDFNWDKHGYALLSKYYPSIVQKMDAVFKTAYNMTDNSINNDNNVDTQPFRIAVWHYTFRLYGVNNDSYEYSSINVYLPIKLKIFIKKLVCYPQIITINDFTNMGVALKQQEKIHIAILALTAKYQATLLFGLKAIMKYIQSN